MLASKPWSRWLAPAGAALVLFSLSPLEAAAQMLVHPLKVSLTVLSEFPDNGDLSIEKNRATDRVLINLAQGLAIDRKVPSNEILALIVNCETLAAEVVVWDAELEQRVVDLSEIIDLSSDLVVQTRGGLPVRGEVVAELDFSSTEGASYSLDGGELVVGGKVKFADFEGSHCPQSLQASAIGSFEATIEGAPFSGIITKGKISARKPIGEEFLPL